MLCCVLSVLSNFFHWFFGRCRRVAFAPHQFSCVAVLWLAAAVLLLPLWLSFVAVRSAAFVRIRCPRFRPARSPRCGVWSCVRASSLPSFRCSRFVFAVRPAVISRRSGVVLFFWVFSTPAAPKKPPETLYLSQTANTS